MKQFWIIAILALATAGCSHGQPTPTPSPSAAATWAASSSCTASAPCTYVISRATCTGPTQVSCPSGFTPLNLASPTSTLSYTDSAPPAGYVSYVVSALQALPGCPTGGCISPASPPSNNGVPSPVPASVAAPGAPTVTAGVAAPLVPTIRRPNGRPSALVAPVGVTVTVRPGI
jgi:hypothetical protein